MMTCAYNRTKSKDRKIERKDAENRSLWVLFQSWAEWEPIENEIGSTPIFNPAWDIRVGKSNLKEKIRLKSV